VYFACLPFKAKDASHPQKTRPIQTLGSAVRLEYPLARGVAVSAETLPQFQSSPVQRIQIQRRASPEVSIIREASPQRLPRLSSPSRSARPDPALAGAPQTRVPSCFASREVWLPLCLGSAVPRAAAVAAEAGPAGGAAGLAGPSALVDRGWCDPFLGSTVFCSLPSESPCG
jgi:hypothetical protein